MNAMIRKDRRLGIAQSLVLALLIGGLIWGDTGLVMVLLVNTMIGLTGWRYGYMRGVTDALETTHQELTHLLDK
jgi:hypothetical protein